MNIMSNRKTCPCPPSSRGGCGTEKAVYVQDWRTIEGFGRVYVFSCANCGRIQVPLVGTLHSTPDAMASVWADRKTIKDAIAKAEGR